MISPGKFGGTDIRRARAALQFYHAHLLDYLLDDGFMRAYHSADVTVSSMRTVHRGYIDVSTMYKPVLQRFDTKRSTKVKYYEKVKLLTSVTIIPANGPRKTV